MGGYHSNRRSDIDEIERHNWVSAEGCGYLLYQEGFVDLENIAA